MKELLKASEVSINEKRNQVATLQKEIRSICFECIEKSKDITVGDLVYIPSKNKYGIFIDLHNEDVSNQVIKTNLLTKLGLPSKNVTTVQLNDLEKVTDSIENIINNNFEGEDFDPQKAIHACEEAIKKLK